MCTLPWRSTAVTRRRDQYTAESTRGLGSYQPASPQEELRFADFKEALTFVNRVGELAEEQGHHPDICFGWGHAEITIWTHKIDGLTESDFILAAKIDSRQS